ncbi:50S ribosomal protein L15 [Nitzschia inconspicua]|uniref:50S ribosomal protein L15 n=1 Tax=Nitzschia inconspicua TaxID=303405 RepID=A0A9K3Q447_9STRA|nr:50S ribosomal protein L15 [Nitzschia inconspicua]
MFSSLCRQFTSACSIHTTSQLSALSVVASSSSIGRCFQSSLASSKKNNDEFVAVLKLNMLQDNPGAVKKKRRIGRGIGSSKGKTAGRGHKGQKARSGGSISLGFEGGQTRFFKLLPKRGFSNKRHKTDMMPINLGTIQDYIDMGRLVVPDNSNVALTMKDLLDAGLCTASSVKHGIKLLAKGKERLRTPIHLEISRASEEAIEAVEAVGGEITTVHYNRLAVRALLKPQKFVADDGTGRLPKFARPPPKWQPYYTNWDRNRGYLSVQAQMRKLLKERPELESDFTKALEEHKNA